MNEAPRPKPGPPKTSSPVTQDIPVQPSKPEVKKPYIFKPHLTSRPFNDPKIAALRDSIKKPTPQKRAPKQYKEKK